MPNASRPHSDTTPLPTANTAYPIRAVSLMTGVSIDTLRAWERRYAAVTPRRDGRGRVYSEADVSRVRRLHDAVLKGHAIGRIARLSDEELSQLTAAGVEAEVSTPPSLRTGEGFNTDVVIHAIERFDVTTLEKELARAAALLPVSSLLSDVVVPLLTEIGERWHDGRCNIAHEHLLSASVRNLLGSLLRIHQRTDEPDKLMFATLAGERHELGTLGAAVLAASGGLGTIYLGSGMPADDILSILQVVQVEIVVLGVSGLMDSNAVDTEGVRFAHALPATTELWLGGAGAKRLSQLLNRPAVVLSTFAALEQQLVRVGARF